MSAAELSADVVVDSSDTSDDDAMEYPISSQRPELIP